MRKINWNKTFRLGEAADIECGWQNTSYGFRHLAVLRTRDQRYEAKACYYNRTWEAYEYQSVVHAVIQKAFPKAEAQKYFDIVDGKADADLKRDFGMIAGFAKLGEILCEKPEDKNAWKEKMLKAGLDNRGRMIPDDWGSLPEDEKQRRLDGAIKELRV